METSDKLSNLIRELPMKIEKKRLNSVYYKQVGELVKELDKVYPTGEIRKIWEIFDKSFKAGKKDFRLNPWRELDVIDDILKELTGEMTPYQKSIKHIEEICQRGYIK